MIITKGASGLNWIGMVRLLGTETDGK